MLNTSSGKLKKTCMTLALCLLVGGLAQAMDREGGQSVSRIRVGNVVFECHGPLQLQASGGCCLEGNTLTYGKLTKLKATKIVVIGDISIPEFSDLVLEADEIQHSEQNS